MSLSLDAVEHLVTAELAREAPPEAAEMAALLRKDWGPGVAAVLFHGSCLRDRVVEDRILDLYLLVDSYAAVHSSLLARVTNAILPPNVYHARKVVAGRTLHAKCSVVSLSAFERRTARSTFEPYFWARFAQRCALLWARDERVRQRVGTALAAAAVVLVQETRPLFRHRPAARDLWVEAFRRTYGSELRSESETRAAELYAADSCRYDRIATIVTSGVGAPAAGQRRRARLRWQMRRIAGKPLTALRLLKAAFTFEGGADYLVWKIGRHSAAEIKLSAWQRRHPILASPTLLWRLYRRGAVR
jgi:hypothetical protein